MERMRSCWISDHGDLSRKEPFDHEETKEVKKGLDEIDKNFDEARGVKFKVN